MLSNNYSTPDFFLVSEAFANIKPVWMLIFCFLLFLGLEVNFPEIKHSARQLRKSYTLNISLFGFNSLLISLLSINLLLTLAEKNSFRWLELNLLSRAGQLIVAFILYDLLLYFWHRVSHYFELLWQFHKIHHSDAIMNIMTAFRLHLVDVLMITLVKATYLVVFGFDKPVIITNEFVNTVFLMFHHSNIAFKVKNT